MKSLLSFNGRISRVSFLFAYVVSVLAILILAAIFGGISSTAEASAAASGSSLLFAPGFWIGTILSIISSFTFLWIVLAMAAKRCHDIGWSAWALLFILVPILGFLLFVLYPGQVGPNKYGEPPQ